MKRLTGRVLQTVIVCKWILWWACGLFSAMIEMTRHVLIRFFIFGSDIILAERVYNFVARAARVSREDRKRTAISLWS